MTENMQADNLQSCQTCFVRYALNLFAISCNRSEYNSTLFSNGVYWLKCSYICNNSEINVESMKNFTVLRNH